MSDTLFKMLDEFRQGASRASVVSRALAHIADPVGQGHNVFPKVYSGKLLRWQVGTINGRVRAKACLNMRGLRLVSKICSTLEAT